MSEKTAKIIRVATVSPLVAFATLLITYFGKPQYFADSAALWTGIVCVVVLPLLSYPLQPICPHFKSKGRQGQRTLAIVFSVAGYVICCVTAIVVPFGSQITAFFVTYLVSGVILLATCKLPMRPSGHACGVAGPIAFLSLFVSPWYLFGATILFPVLWSSAKLKRHTLAESLLGCAVSVSALFVAALITGAL